MARKPAAKRKLPSKLPRKVRDAIRRAVANTLAKQPLTKLQKKLLATPYGKHRLSVVREQQKHVCAACRARAAAAKKRTTAKKPAKKRTR